MKAKRSMMKFSMSRGSGTIQAKFRLLALVCFSLTVSTLLTGCFEETQVLVLNKDGSGHYESVIRFNPQMSVYIEMAEKVVAVKGLPSADDSPFGMLLPNLETSIRAKVEQIEGARLLHFETSRFGEQNEQKLVSFALDFDDINTFLASPLGFEKLGLRLSKDDDGNLHLKGTPSPLVAIPPAVGGAPSLGMLISQMKSEFGVADDAEFDALFRRLLSSPKSALTFVAPTTIKQTNGTLVPDNKVEWNIDIIDSAGAPSRNLYEVVLDGAELAFDVREMPQPAVTPSSFVGQPAPEFTLTDLEGKTVSLSDFKGKVVILDFWATWCGPCVVEIPYFIKLQEEFGEKGFTMLGVSTDDGMDVVKKFVEEHQVNYPILMADGNVKALYGGIQSIPTTFVLDKEGVIQRHYVGTQPEAVFRQDVETLLTGGELPPQPIHTMPSPGPPQPPTPVAKPFEGKATIQPLGIQIGTTAPNLSEPEEWKRIRPFWGPGGGDGTTASLLVTIPSGGIVSIDERASAVAQFSDDTGKNLLIPTQSRRFGPGSPVQKMDIRGANREYATVFVSAPGRPSEDATSLSIAGNIAIVRGGRTETYEQSDIALDKEQRFTLGELSYQWAPGTLSDFVSLGRRTQNMLIGTMTTRGSQAAHDAILRTQFFSETGAEIPAETFEWSSYFDGDFRVEKQYGFPKDTKTVKIVVTSWTDNELLTIPFEVMMGLNGTGLPVEVSDISVQSILSAPAESSPPSPPGRPSAPLVGQSASVFTLTDLEGKSVSLSEFKGKVVLLDFWATWCPPCAKEIPHFIELYEQYKEQGFEMVGISVDKEGIDVIKPFVEQHRVNYPILIADGRVTQLYGGISSIPTTFLIDKEGKIQRRYVGYRDKSVFEADIKAFLTGE